MVRPESDLHRLHRRSRWSLLLDGFAEDAKRRIIAAIILVAALVGAWGSVKESQDRAEFEQEMRQGAEETIASTIGGTSFSYLSPLSLGKKNSFFVAHKGDFPLYDVVMRVLDLDKIGPSDTIEGIDLRKFLGRTIALGNMTPGHAIIMLDVRWVFGASKVKRYNVFFTARNGSWSQELRIREKGDDWLIANRVHRNEKVIYEDISDGYPKNTDGEVVWE